jgi:hypothetical protein
MATKIMTKRKRCVSDYVKPPLCDKCGWYIPDIGRDDDYREWGQLYFVLNPQESKKLNLIDGNQLWM